MVASRIAFNVQYLESSNTDETCWDTILIRDVYVVDVIVSVQRAGSTLIKEHIYSLRKWLHLSLIHHGNNSCSISCLFIRAVWLKIMLHGNTVQCPTLYYRSGCKASPVGRTSVSLTFWFEMSASMICCSSQNVHCFKGTRLKWKCNRCSF